jgi:hypothetical protein
MASVATEGGIAALLAVRSLSVPKRQSGGGVNSSPTSSNPESAASEQARRRIVGKHARLADVAPHHHHGAVAGLHHNGPLRLAGRRRRSRQASPEGVPAKRGRLEAHGRRGALNDPRHAAIREPAEQCAVAGDAAEDPPSVIPAAVIHAASARTGHISGAEPNGTPTIRPAPS